MILNKLKGFAARIGIAAVVTTFFAMHVYGGLELGFVSQIERNLYDARIRLTLPNSEPDSVVILDIDEKSIAALGHWAWPRNIMAAGVDRLFDDYGIRVLGFDIVFAEAWDPSALEMLQHIEAEWPDISAAQREVIAQQKEKWDTDTTFAESLIGRNVVLGYVFKDYVAENDPATTGKLPDPMWRKEQLSQLSLDFIEAQGFVGSYDLHMDAVGVGGFFSNPSVDDDGIFRRVPMLQSYQGDVYPSLALEVARKAMGNAPLQFVFADPSGELNGLNLEGIKLGEQFIPVDERLSSLVPYQGRAGTFDYVSFIDVLNNEVDIERLFDKVVLVGTSAPGLLDLRASPVGSRFIGVEIHANLVHGILQGGMKQSPQFMQGVEFLSLLLVAVVISILTLLPALVGIAGLVSIVVGVFYLGVYGWSVHHIDVPVASVIGQALLLFLLQFSYSFAVESRKKRHLSKVFGQYIPEELVADLDKSEQDVSLEGENREMSVLFSDVRSFTTISEGLDPVELTQLMNEFLTPITKVIHEHRGTIDKYMGDAVMAFWGAPLVDKQHAYNAVAAGLQMIVALDELQPHFQARGWPEIKIGVGANTGPMNVGNMGSEFRMAYTVLGDTVNLGSRLEGLTKQYGVQFIVSQMTADAAPEFLYRALDVVKVKGKNEPVPIVEPIGLADAADAELTAQLEQWNQALSFYYEQRWQDAEAQIRNLQQAEPDRMIYQIYLDRIAHFQQESPGPDWDGVFTHTSK